MKKQVLVVGGARSGISIAKLLLQQGYEVYLTDMQKIDNTQFSCDDNIHIYDQGHPAFLLDNEYEFVVKNPGIPYHAPFIKKVIDKKIPIYTEVEVASWFANNYTYGAITGTNGKTTATTLLRDILMTTFKTSEAGNIGKPLAEVVLEDNKDYKIALELSNFQLLGCKKLKPKVSTILNLTPDHLDYMDNDLNAYYSSKFKIMQACDEDDYFLLNLDDQNIVDLMPDCKCKVLTYSLKTKADIYIDNNILFLKDEPIIDLNNIQVFGDHNYQNIMVASTMAYLLGVSKENIQKAVDNFKGVEHRLEYVGNHHDIKFYNDSKSTNPDALIKALNAFDKPVILLMGGYNKGNDFHFLNDYNHKINHLICYGDTSQIISDCYQDKSYICNDLEEAFQKALALANPNDVVLLSPACASYDQYQSYEKRGEHFKELVKGVMNND